MMMTPKADLASRELLQVHRRLFRHFGDLHWWPGDTPFEIMLGSILTQNTAWTNVEKAIANLKNADLLSPEAIIKASPERLGELIRPSRYFRQKVERVKDFSRFFLAEPYRGDFRKMAGEGVSVMREKLLARKGIGPETADSIMLYGLELPVFMIDAYTLRIFERLVFLKTGAKYREAQEFFHRRLPSDVGLYNQFHAEIVNLGQKFCKPRPLCPDCPLKPLGRCPDPAGVETVTRVKGPKSRPAKKRIGKKAGNK